MAVPLRPQLRPLKIDRHGPPEDLLFVLQDPEGYGKPLVIPCGVVVLAGLMNGQRTLSEIKSEFQTQTGVQVALNDLEQIVRRLDEAYLLGGRRFEHYRREQIESYLGNPVRPASHAGAAYCDDPEELREQLAGFFTCEGGPGAIDPSAIDPSAIDPSAGRDGRRLCGIVSPHIDLHRGGPVFAWAYKQVVQRSDADLFVIFGTGHHPMEEPFCTTRKDFDTPLGIVRTDGPFIDRMVEHLAGSVVGRRLDLFADEMAHRLEHSIEFQAMFLQYVLGGRREFRIVPVLVGSFEGFINGGTHPGDSPEVEAFLAAVRAAAERHPGGVCYISGADFAHIGRQFEDDWLVDKKRLAEQSADDRALIEAACRGDSDGFFSHVADQLDRSRICGLPPTYTLLEAIRPARGELLKYGQAVEPDGSACVSFAGVAFYRE